VFAQRKSELLAICNRLDAAKTMLISEKDKINNYTAFEKNILSRVIDALKYRRERTRGKTHNLFANKELCESRVTILTNYISQLEAGFCQTTAELNALLEKLRIDNSSKNLPFRVVDKLGGLNKLLVSHSINNNDFDMFDEPCNKYRRNG
jgi:hypothetical protein